MKSYDELLEQVRENLNDDKRFKSNLIWIDDMVTRYSEFLGLTKQEVLSAFEDSRDYWSANFYQEAKQPKLEGDINIYETKQDLIDDIQPDKGFVCPACNEISSDYQECKSGHKDKNGKVCDWKSYGLLGTLGKGYRVLVKEGFLENPTVHDIFMPKVIYDKLEKLKDGEY